MTALDRIMYGLGIVSSFGLIAWVLVATWNEFFGGEA
jgi:hypothetical protein